MCVCTARRNMKQIPNTWMKNESKILFCKESAWADVIVCIFSLNWNPFFPQWCITFVKTPTVFFLSGVNTWQHTLTWNHTRYIPVCREGTDFITVIMFFSLVDEGVCSRHEEHLGEAGEATVEWFRQCHKGNLLISTTIYKTSWNFDSHPFYL